MKTHIIYLFILCFLKSYHSSAQVLLPNDYTGRTNEFVTDLDLNRYETISDELEEVNKKIKELEEFREILFNRNKEYTHFKNTIPTKDYILSESIIKDNVQKIEKLISEFDRRSSIDTYLRIRELYNSLTNQLRYGNTFRIYIYDPEVRSFKTNFQNDIDSKIGSILGVIINQPLDYSEEQYSNTITESKRAEVLSIKSDIDKIKNSNLKSFNDDLKILFPNKENELISLSKDINERLKKIEVLIKAHKDKKRELTRDINEWGIQTGLPWFCGTVGALFFITVLNRFVSTARHKSSGNSNYNQEHLSKVLLEVITVLLLTLTILILGLSNILKENVLGTLIGGIAGYILNRSRDIRNNMTNRSQTQ